jgi:hypothetical protein
MVCRRLCSLLLAYPALLAAGGCADRACESEPPAMQVILELAPSVSTASIQTLRADVAAAGLAKTADLATEPLKSNRRATFVVLVGDPGAGGFLAQISVKALDAGGAVIARGDETFSASGDGCNAFSLRLSDGGDGGLPDGPPIVLDQGPKEGAPTCGPSSCMGCCQTGGVCATGTADSLCGKGGVVCTDCSKAGSVCQAGACLGVTYAWKTSSFGSCSATCLGIWTRTVWCERSDGTKVSDSFCSGTKPAISEACNTSCSHSWKSSTFGACSKKCDGGTQTATVWCERSDGVKVSDNLCSGTKPPTSKSCNTQACCSTDTLASGKRCGGSAYIQWTHWGSDSGSTSDRASCATSCTSWAKGQGKSQWCCQLYEDSSSGTNWVCRVYDTYSTTSSTGLRYGGLGRCNKP